MKKIIIYIVTTLSLIALAFYLGWFVRDAYFPKLYRPQFIRENGFNFIKPLILCDANPERKYPEISKLENDIKTVITSQQKSGTINDASVFFLDFKTGGRFDINKDSTFNPASLAKLSVMIAYYKMAENNPELLDEKIKVTYDANHDYNNIQEIKPDQFAENGKTYTVRELIKLMINDSDNNSYYALLNFVDPNVLKKIFNDLQIPDLVIQDPNSLNNITSNEISYLFRVLYGSTYLSRESSEEIMQMMTESHYKAGIASGVNPDVKIANKYGLLALKENGAIIQRELHDCGIIYDPNHPYLLCIMTKSNSSISQIEDMMKTISSKTYQTITAQPQ